MTSPRTPDPALLAAARAYAEATWNYDPGSYSTPAARERHLDQDALSTAREPWFAALWERGVAEGRRQATEGYSRDVEWTMRYRLNGTLALGEDGGHVLDSREDAERHIDVWRRHYPDLTYTDVEYLRREVLTGPWEAAEQAEPTCTCPMIDVTTAIEKPGSVTVKGYDPACPVCPSPNAEQDGADR